MSGRNAHGSRGWRVRSTTRRSANGGTGVRRAALLGAALSVAACSREGGRTLGDDLGTFSVQASDVHGNATTVTVTYTVVYRFDGFSAPVDPSATNVVKAGRTVPLKWRLTGRDLVVADIVQVLH